MNDVHRGAGGEYGEGSSPIEDRFASASAAPLTKSIVSRLTRLLDGPHDWGSIDVYPVRHGVARYRLVVFPPGIDVVERRLLRAWRAWPTWGALLFVAMQIVVSVMLSPATALAASSGVYLLTGAVLFASAAELRSRVRTLTVVRIAGFSDARSVAMFAELTTLLGALCHEDAQRDSGQWSPAAHEAVWWQVYDRLDG